MTDNPSFLFRLILRSLGAGHPIRLALGVALGVMAKVFADGFAATYPESAALKAIAGYQAYWFIVASAPLMFLPMVVGKRSAPEKVVHTINTMQAILDKAKLSRVNEQLFWRSLLDKYVAAAKPELSVEPNLDEVFKDTAKEVPISNDPAPT